MQARCPHCQNVFTTAGAGHQPCPHCARQVNVPDVRGAGPRVPLDPYAAPPSAEPLPEAVPSPWERRGELGLMRGFLLTLKEATFAPGSFWPSLNARGPLLDALLWAWAAVGLGALVSVPFALLEAAQLLAELDRMLLELDAAELARARPLVQGFRDFVARVGPANYLLGLLAAQALFFPLALVVLSGITHAALSLFGAASRGFVATFRALAYASGPAVFIGLPLIGVLASFWSLVLAVWGLRALQATSLPRVLLALGVPLVALACCLPCVVGVGSGAVKASQEATPPTPETIELLAPPLDLLP